MKKRAVSLALLWRDAWPAARRGPRGTPGSGTWTQGEGGVLYNIVKHGVHVCCMARVAAPGPAWVHELECEVVGDAEEAAPVLVQGAEVPTRAEARGQTQQQP